MKRLTLIWLIVLLPTLIGCNDPESGKGFSLPKGDAPRGAEVFVQLKCNACHSVGDIAALESLAPPLRSPIALGGEVVRIQTYGELVTSIINPSHRFAPGHPADAVQADGQSTMTNYNDVMTVSQLVDLVTYLQTQYKLKEYELTDYPPYY